MSVQSQLKEKWLLYQLEERKDTEAFGQLYDLYVSRIYRFIYFKISSQSDAEDLTAEVFLKAWEHINSGKEIKKFAGLLYRIARNKVIDFYRRKAIAEKPWDETLLQKFSDGGESAEEIERGQEARLMIKSLQILKDEYREVLTLRFLDELSVGEISEIIGKTRLSTRVLLHRALKTLKKVTEQQEEETKIKYDRQDF